MERGTEYGLEQVFNVIDSRLPQQQAADRHDQPHAGRPAEPGGHRPFPIYDRLLSMCVPVRFTGDNFRQEAAQRKMESMKKLITD